MNILPHKSWHVWRRDNIEKVERDEANHRKELEKERQKELARKRKERFELLKGTNPKDIKLEEQQQEEEEAPKPKAKHYSLLFGDLEKKYEIEQKKAQKHNEELIQKMDGACPLGKCSAETMRRKPWYHKLPSELQEEQTDLTAREKRKKRRQEKSKRIQDPMAEVTRSLAKQKEVDYSSTKTRRKEKEDRLQSLREQRLKREKLERNKSLALLSQTGQTHSQNNDRSSSYYNHSSTNNHKSSRNHRNDEKQKNSSRNSHYGH